MGIFGQNAPGQPRYSGEEHNLQITESVYGTCAPIIFGTTRVHQKLLFYGGFYAVTAPNASGKGIFGGKSTEWDYYADCLMLLAQGSEAAGCIGILNVWDQDGKLQNQGQVYAYTIPGSSPNVIPSSSPSIGSDLGVFKTASYSVVANDYGAGGPQTLTGTQQVRFTKVASSPGAGQYTFDASTGEYGFSTADVGTAVAISYSTVFSLYYFQQTQAALVPGSPYQVSTDNQAYFWADNGCFNVNTGAPLTEGAPTNGYTQSSGFYTFTSDLVGVLVYINYTYTSTDADVTNSSSLNLTFFAGTQGQSPWSYMTSKYPGSNFGYSGLCYVGANPLFLGQSASMPSYNYELIGLVPFGGGIYDAHPCDALYLLLTDKLLGVDFPAANIDPAWVGATAAATGPNAYAYWAANNYFVSIAIDTQQSAAEALRSVIEAGNVAPVWSGGVLKLIPYGDATTVGNGYTYQPTTTPVLALTWDDLLPPSDKNTGQATSDDPLQVTLRAPQDCMNYVQVQWTNRENDYNVELTPEQNDAFINTYGFRPESPQTWEFLTTQAAATWALNLRLKRNCYIRANYKFWLPFWFAALEPMDMIVLPTGEAVRITQIEDDPNGRLSIEAEQWSYGTADVTLYPKQPATSYQPTQSGALPGNTYPVIFEATPQSLLAKPNTVQFAVAGNQAAWGGCQIYASPDGTTWTQIDRVTSQARSGLLFASLASHADPDTSDTLSVDMTISGGELVSVTAAQWNAFASLAAIVDASGTIELIAFETATLVAQNRYTLTNLRRGVYGTPILAHAVGAEFTYIGATGIFNYQYPAQYAGKTMYFKFASFNTAGQQLQELSQCIEYPFLIPGTSLQPPSSGSFASVPAQPLTSSYASGSSEIFSADFIAQLNNQSVSCVPSGPITGLTPGQSFWIYYVDLAFAGGSISLVATQTLSDFQGKTGYYQLLGPNTDGSITTATGASYYRPSAYIDSGTQSVANPSYAFDTNPSSAAAVVARAAAGGPAFNGDIEYYTLPNVTPSSVTLYVTAATTASPAAGQTLAALIECSFDGGSTWTSMLSTGATTAQATYSQAVPGGTNLSQIQVVSTTTASVPSLGSGAMAISVYDINVH